MKKKLFKRIPYSVRYKDEDSLSVPNAEDAITEYMHEFDLIYGNIAKVYNDNKDNKYKLTVELRNCEVPKFNFWYNINDDLGIEIVSTKFTTENRQIDSLIIEDYLREKEKLVLLQSFKAMVSCYNGQLYNSLNKEAMGDYNDPSSRYYPYRQNIISNQSFIWELSHKFNLDPLPLFKSLNFDMRKNSNSIIKITADKLGISIKELGEKIGVTEGSLNNASSTGKVSKQLEKSLKLLVENETMKKDLEIIRQFKQLLNK